MYKIIFRNILIFVAISMQISCATHVALSMPGPSQDKHVRLGMNQREVESYLGVGPASRYVEDNQNIVRYEYSDGPSGASKIRVILYLAGDVLLLGLSEIIFWPIELHVEKQIKRIATAVFSKKNSLREWTVRRKEGGDMLDYKVSKQPIDQDNLNKPLNQNNIEKLQPPLHHEFIRH